MSAMIIEGGSYGMGYFLVNVHDQATPGQVNDWTYGAEYRFLTDDTRFFALRLGRI